MKIFLLPMLVLLLSAPFARSTAQCNDPIEVSHEREPPWVSGRRPPETDVSYFDVIMVKGNTLDEARRKADEEAVQRRSKIAGGGRAQIQNTDGGTSLQYQNSLEVQYKMEREYYKRCGNNEYHLFQLVQFARIPGKELPPIQSEYLRKQRRWEEQREKRDAIRHKTRWVSVGVGTGIIPDDTAGFYSGAVTGVGGGYVAGRYSAFWGRNTHYTLGIGGILGVGQGSEGLRIGGGINIYPFGDAFLQFSYGTATYSQKIKGYYDNGRYIGDKTITENGITAMAGYEFHISRILLSIAAGMTKPESRDWMPAYSASIGYVHHLGAK